jgi:hypothetical protein
MTPVLRLDLVPGDRALVVRPVGTLTRATYPALLGRLLKCAVHEPAAIIVDLDYMSADPWSLTVFSAVSVRIKDWPGIPLILVECSRFSGQSIMPHYS